MTIHVLPVNFAGINFHRFAMLLSKNTNVSFKFFMFSKVKLRCCTKPAAKPGSLNLDAQKTAILPPCKVGIQKIVWDNFCHGLLDAHVRVAEQSKFDTPNLYPKFISFSFFLF